MDWYNVRCDLRSHYRMGINTYKVALDQKKNYAKVGNEWRMLEVANLLCIRIHSKGAQLLAHR